MPRAIKPDKAVKSAVKAGWPAKVRRRDGTLVVFDVARIEAAVGAGRPRGGFRRPRYAGDSGQGRCRRTGAQGCAR